MVQANLSQQLVALREREEAERQQLLFSDLDRLLELSEHDDLPFADLLTHFLRILRAHAWVENAAIFGMML
jgi:hypothetical protein